MSSDSLDEKKEQRIEVEHINHADTRGAIDHPSHPETRMTRVRWLACIALSLSYTTAFQQNACTAAIVKHIDAELGPTTYYNWMLSGYTISVSVMYPLSGGLSDIFGRRWFFIVGSIISLIGTAVALGAQDVPTVISAMILKGIGAGSQQLALAAIAEIVPNKHRGMAQAGLDIVTLPWSVFGGLIGNAMIAGGGLTFRINFILGVCLNVATIVSIFFWYKPPTAPYVGDMTKWQRLLKLDWIGVILMAIGIVLTLMGLAFGGSTYAWGEAGNVAPLVIGITSLIALGFWEWKGSKDPFFAHELFVGRFRTFTLMLVITFVGGMSLYTAMAFWTQQCQGMFFRDPMKIGVSAIPGGFGGTIGGFLGGVLVGKFKAFKIPYMLVLANVIKLIADAVFTTLKPDDYPLALGMGFIAMFGMGMSLVALIVGVQLTCEDKNIGLATLVLGSVRAIGGSVAITIYTTILQNTIAQDAGPRIAAAVVPLGVPIDSLTDFVPLLIGAREDLAALVPGVSAEALAVAEETIKYTWAKAFSHIYYAAMSFSILAIVASAFVRDVTGNMTDSVAVRLENDEKKEEGKKEVDV